MYSFGDMSFSKASLAGRLAAHTQVCQLFKKELRALLIIRNMSVHICPGMGKISKTQAGAGTTQNQADPVLSPAAIFQHSTKPRS